MSHPTTLAGTKQVLHHSSIETEVDERFLGAIKVGKVINQEKKETEARLNPIKEKVEVCIP